VFTTDYSLSKYGARSLMNRYLSRLKKELKPNNEGLLVFWVAERFKAKDGHHLHVLIKLPTNALGVSKSMLEKIFQIVSGARKHKKYFRADIKKYDKRLHGAYYCSKDLILSTTSYDMLS